MTNFERRWAWFFTLLGWHWKYFPTKHGFQVQPTFRVEFPCGHSECDGSHTLDVFLRRGVLSVDRFGVSVYDLASPRKGADSPYYSPHPALYGDNPGVTVWEMCHGSGGGQYDIPTWVPDWHDLWTRACSLTRTALVQSAGRLGL
jgi:hypothetical protein